MLSSFYCRGIHWSLWEYQLKQEHCSSQFIGLHNLWCPVASSYSINDHPLLKAQVTSNTSLRHSISFYFFAFNFSTMVLMTFRHELMFKLVLSLAIFHTVIAGDPDITLDFIIPPNVTNVDSNLFTFTGMRILLQAPLPTAFKVTKASIAEFPALNGQSVSYGVLQYTAGSVNPPHTHPRSAEL